MSIQRDNLIAYFERQIEFQHRLIQSTPSVFIDPRLPPSIRGEMTEQGRRFLKIFRAMAEQQQAEARTIITQLKENRVEPSIIVMYQGSCALQQKHFNSIYGEDKRSLKFTAVPNDILNFAKNPGTPPQKWEDWTAEDDWAWKALLKEEGSRFSAALPPVDTSTKAPIAAEVEGQLTTEDWRILDSMSESDFLALWNEPIPDTTSASSTKDPKPDDAMTKPKVSSTTPSAQSIFQEAHKSTFFPKSKKPARDKRKKSQDNTDDTDDTESPDAKRKPTD